jgi:uncharacterized protein YecT (DUF1311 family)
MKLVACVLACLSLSVLAQTPVKAADVPVDVPVQDKITALRKQGAEALSRERVRRKVDLCAHPLDGSDPAVGNCWLREGRKTDANYTAYVRSIGGLLRLSLQTNRDAPLPAGSPQRLEFDTAEATWLSYRKQTCDAMTAQWEGGTLYRTAYPKCLVTVTWNHMNELDGLYSELWDGR